MSLSQDKTLLLTITHTQQSYITTLFIARESIPYHTGYWPVRPVFFFLKPKPVQKHISFVPIQIPVIPSYSGLTGANIVFWLKNLYLLGTEKSRLSDLKKKKKEKSLTNLISVTFWFIFPHIAAASMLLKVIPFRRAPFFFFPIQPYQVPLSSVLFHLPFQILFICLFSFYVPSLFTQG